MSRVAAIDCGTNSIRLLIADVTTSFDGTPQLRDLHREMRIVRLGKGVDATGELDPEALERTRVALVDYAAAVRRKGVERVRMVATSATRDASNREDFFGMVRDTLGIDAEVISGDEEARLSFEGAVGELDPEDGPFVVVDVGGGSTELVVGELVDGKASVTAAKSVDVGSVRLTERCLPGDPPSPEDVGKARKVAGGILDEAFAAVPVEGVKTWVGVAGTITTLSGIAQDLPEYDPEAVHLSRLSREDIHRVAQQLVTSPKSEREKLGALHPGRVDVIAAGAIVVEALADELHERAGIDEMVVSEHDILDGIARSIAV
ncbi:MAG: exopolyphosphatase [Pseudonocardia sp.]|jgi:exopolyphosphatase/guanosine-5'-triphosphate,3'-diphosphate pyrophosphatase|uniref:Ppx/GppA phosphatase family protein n=1 Tax=Pseudonocardia sp. TaxID=60912 RepID=UPI002603330C|nr:Ppx/GppA phosphatase family protein [Pseudonocardia sp.]MCU1626194.1 exopolyphosphatase [Pseudonocardia sp.]MDT7701167.1 exopolyphosphatase / guanosine-5-triphosphate,3-diphosphate pyrophosphatase [Pseudonocardiales bacterium]HEV7469474.1 Ppx/GppA phosphatase family protein [Pseudonocardia sp.]